MYIQSIPFRDFSPIHLFIFYASVQISMLYAKLFFKNCFYVKILDFITCDQNSLIWERILPRTKFEASNKQMT